jgi:hypothetical protein
MPSEAEFTMLDAMFSKDPNDWDNWARANGFEPDQDLPICLASIPQDQWIVNSKVIPNPAVQRYLESGDTLTNHAIDMMEIAIEKAFGVDEPWYVTSTRRGREQDGSLAVEYFYLGAEC